MARRVHTFVILLIASLLALSPSWGESYYIDSVDGNDSNDGLSTNTPWASHTKAESTSLAAGDTVHFKRGSAFSGAIVISESGSPGNPIRLTSYGSGELPRFTNPSTSDESGNAIRVGGDFTIVENLHFHDTPGEYVSSSLIMTRLGALRINRGADHCIIRSNVFMKCGQGIISAGQHTLITKNYLDGPSYALWRSDDSSWGPMGIHLNIGNQEVSYNTIKNYGTTDSPWGSDGGAIEIDYSGWFLDPGPWPKTNIYIHHNYSEGNAGFIESSWDYDFMQYGEEARDWRVSFNVCYDGQSWLFMLAPCTGVYFDNNTVARYNGFGRSQNWGARMDVRGGSPVGVASGAHFRNNLFIYKSRDNPYQGNRSAGALKTGNWYMRIDSPGRACTGDANQVGSGDPKLKDLSGGNYKLMPDSPLRGAATNLSAFYPNGVDFNGQPLPTNGNWDVGAMQYIADDDADGMPDSWEFDHGLNIDTNDAAGHNDDDGISNYAEYLADTDPTDAESVLAMIDIEMTNSVVVAWKGGKQARQFLEVRTDLVSSTEQWSAIYTNEPDTPVTNLFVDTSPTNDLRFYRIRVERPSQVVSVPKDLSPKRGAGAIRNGS